MTHPCVEEGAAGEGHLQQALVGGRLPPLLRHAVLKIVNILINSINI